MKKELVITLLKTLNIYDKNIPDIYNFNKYGDLNIIDKDLNKKILDNILKPLKIVPYDETDFINKIRLSDVYIITDAALTVRGLKQKWENVALKYDEVLKDELSSRIIVLFHYITIAFRDLGFDIVDVFLDKFNKEKISVSDAINKANEVLLLILENDKELFTAQEIKFNIVEDLEYLKNHIINSKTRLSPEIFEYFEDLVENNKLRDIDVNKIKFKENKIKVIKIYLKEGVDFVINNIEDVLRLMVQQITGIPALIYTKELKKRKKFLLDDKYKKDFWKLLNNSYKLKGNKEKLIKLYKQKRKLFNKLMALYNYQKFVDLYDYEVLKDLRKLKNRKGKIYSNVKTDYQVLYDILDEHLDKDSAIKFLKENSYLFVDKTLLYLKALKRYFDDKLLTEILNSLSLKNLIRVYNYLNKLNKIGNDDNFELKKYLYIMPHSTYGKDISINKDNLYIPFYLDVLKNIKNYISNKFTENLKDLIKEKIENEKIFYDVDIEMLKNYENIKVPFAIDRSLSNMLLERGSYFKFDDDVLRVGIYWENVGNVRVDLDLSVAFIGENYESIDIVSWDAAYMLKDREKVISIFSGDITDGKYGAAEFIDVDLSRARYNNFKYLILAVNNFSAVGEDVVAYAGIMNLNKDEFLKERLSHTEVNKIKSYFNPEKLKISNEIKLKKSYSVVGVIDLEDKFFYPLNIQGGKELGSSLTGNIYLTYIADRIKVEHFSNLSYLDLYDLIKNKMNEINEFKDSLINSIENDDIKTFKVDNLINLNNLVLEVVEK